MSKIPTISVQGKAFVDEFGARFMVRGVALSSNTLGKDLLSNEYLDYMTHKVLPRLQYLNVNTVRVYQVNLNAEHDQVMNMLADSGIYVQIGVVDPASAINRTDPIYSYTLYKRATDVVKKFSQYVNTFAFSVGNEVVFPGNIYDGGRRSVAETKEIELKAAAVVKSLIRDVKLYMKEHGFRPIPVGMAMQDGPQTTVPELIGTDIVAQYYACGEADSRADYIGINSYAYITPPQGSGDMHAYDRYANEVKDIPVPVFLTESGAMNFAPGTRNPVSTRDWAIVPEVYRSDLLYNNLSGQVAFQFFNKQEGLGLYEEDGNLTQTEYGGADNLAHAFQTDIHISVPMPTAVTDPSSCPTTCNPALLPNPVPNITITIENYANTVLKVVQNQAVLADLDAGSNSTPTSTRVQVSNQLNLFILKPNNSNWYLVCKVADTSLREGIVVKTNVTWGGACNVSLPV